MFEVRSNKSFSYRFTFSKNDHKGREALKHLRENIAKENARPYTTGYRVAIYGRLGKNNPNAWKYKPRVHREIYDLLFNANDGNREHIWNDFNKLNLPNYQNIRHEDAAYFDVYVQMV